MNIFNEKEVPFAHRILFAFIHRKVKQKLLDISSSLRVINGKTQQSEEKYIQIIRDILDNEGITYKLAGSQEFGDFQQINGTDMIIEIKKTQSMTVMCNDTCPSSKAFYIIIFTGNKTLKPRIIGANGYEFIDGKSDIKKLVYTNTYIMNLRKLWEHNPSVVRAYPRGNYNIDMTYMFKKEKFLFGENKKRIAEEKRKEKENKKRIAEEKRKEKRLIVEQKEREKVEQKKRNAEKKKEKRLIVELVNL